MDHLDQDLIAALRQQPRATARALSKTLGVSELVVATRIRRLEASSELRVMALLEMGAVGFEHFVLFGIRVDDRLPAVVAKELIQIPEVQSLTSTSGRFQLTGALFARDNVHLRELLDERLGGVRGVQDLESSLVLETLVTPADMATLKGDATAAAWPASGESLSGLDRLDQEVVSALQVNGRMSFRELGRRLATPEATIRSRIQRLQARDIMRLAAVSDRGDFGTGGHAVLSLRVGGGRLTDVANTLRDLHEVGFLMLTLGRFNLQALLLPTSRENLHELVFRRIPRLAGVKQVEFAEILSVEKQDIRVAPPSPASR